MVWCGGRCSLARRTHDIANIVTSEASFRSPLRSGREDIRASPDVCRSLLYGGIITTKSAGYISSRPDYCPPVPGRVSIERTTTTRRRSVSRYYRYTVAWQWLRSLCLRLINSFNYSTNHTSWYFVSLILSQQQYFGDWLIKCVIVASNGKQLLSWWTCQ